MRHFSLVFLCFVALFFNFFSKLEIRAQNAGSSLSTNLVESKMDEVFGRGFFDHAPHIKQFYTTLINNRIQYKIIPLDPNDKYVKLSTIPLQNKIKPVQRDLTFNAATFNPLKYQMDFSSKLTQVYRFDNTDHVIVILPQ